MASLAPNINDNEGNSTEYLGLSRSVSQPEANKAFAYLGEGLGKAAAGTGKLTKNVYDEAAKSDTAEGAQKLIEEQTAGLETIRDSLTNAPDKEGELTEETAKRASTILEAQKANGSLSATHFDAQMLKYMKDQRAKYPFAVDAVDRGIKQATGHLYSANEYVNKLREQINSFITAKDHNTDKVISHLLSTKEPEAGNVAGALMKDPGNPELFSKAISIINDHNTFYGKIERNRARLEDNKLTDEDKIRIAGHDVEDAIATELNKFNNGVVPGLTGVTTPQLEVQAMNDHVSGVKRMEAKEIRARAQLYQGLVETHLMPKLNKLLTEPAKDAAGNPIPNSSYSSILGSTKTEEIIAKARGNALISQKWLENGMYGPLSTTTNMLSDIKNDDNLRLRAGELGLNLRMYDVMKDQAPPLLEELNSQIAGSKTSSPTTTIKSYANALTARSFVPYNLLPTKDDGKPAVPGNTLHDDANDLRRRHGSIETLAGLADANKHLADPRTSSESARARIDYAFDPKNDDVISNWQPVAQPYISEKLVTRPILERAHKEGPEYWNKVKGFTEVMVKRMLTPDVLALNGLQKTKDDLVRYDDKSYSFKYVARPMSPTEEEERFGPTPERGKREQENLVNFRLAGMNRVLKHIANVAEVEGQDPNEAIYNTLRTYGYDEKGAPPGYNQAMVEAMRATALQKELSEATEQFGKGRAAQRKSKNELLKP